MSLWIRVDAAMPRDAKVLAFADALHVSLPTAVGHLVMLWGVMGEHTPSGDVHEVGVRPLEAWAGWHGKRGAFYAAFVENFVTDGIVRGWESRQGALIERAERERARNAERAARRNRGSTAVTPRIRNVTVRNVTEVQHLSASGDAGDTEPETASPARPPAPQLVRDPDPPETAFLETWASYPVRLGGNPRKAAWKAWRARVKSGVDPGALRTATEHYAQYVRSIGKERTEYVMQGATFYGPNERWREFLDPVAPPAPKIVPGTPRWSVVMPAAVS